MQMTFFLNLLLLLITFKTYESQLIYSFKYYNERITFLCDGSVQEIHSTAELGDEGNFFSTKNHIHALTILMFCSPKKKLLCLTPCIYGSVKDDDLFMRTLPIVAPKLTAEDSGFGDSGFRFNSELRAKIPFHLYTPTGAHNSEEYKNFSKYRIVAENMLQVLKMWECLKQVVREKIKGNDKLLENQSKKWMTVGGMERWRTDGFHDL